MSSAGEPPRKRQKSESTSSQTLQTSNIEDCCSKSPQSSIIPRKSEQQAPNLANMSDSRRRSARKSRNDELKDNEQSVAELAFTRATPTRKRSNRKQVEAEAEADRDDDMGEDLVKSEVDGEDAQSVDNDPTLAELARASIHHRARPSGFSFGSMASLLSSQSSQLKSLLASLKEPDPSVQLIALNELANMLSMSTEESLAGYIQTDAFVVELVSIMRGPNAFGEENPDMMLLACRCLANMMEALPSSTANVAYGGAIPVLCQKLLEIQYIDLAEQALSTLEKISKDYPSSIVREGGMAACLTYLDFFSTNVQRIAVKTAANCARNVPSDCFAIVRDVVPTLQSVIVGTDSKVVESGCLCLTRVLESFRNEAGKIEQMLNSEVLATILRILSPLENNGTNVSEYIKTRFLYVLSQGAKISATIAAQLLRQGITRVIYQLLTGLSTPSNPTEIKKNSVLVLQALIQHSREQITEIINLMSDILPGVPAGEAFADLTAKERGICDSRTNQFDVFCPGDYEQFVTIMLPTLIDIYNSTVDISLRQTTLLAILKICYNLDSNVLRKVVMDVSLAVFITSVLGTRHLHLVLCGARIGVILLEKLGDIYAHKLMVEGSVAELKKLEIEFGHLATQNVPTAQAVDESKEKSSKVIQNQLHHMNSETSSSHLNGGEVSLNESKNKYSEVDSQDNDDEVEGQEDDDITSNDIDADNDDIVEDDDDDQEDDDDEDDEGEDDMDDEDDDDEDDDDDDDELLSQLETAGQEFHAKLGTSVVPLAAADLSQNASSGTSATVIKSRTPGVDIISILIGRHTAQFNRLYESFEMDTVRQNETLAKLSSIATVMRSGSCRTAYSQLANVVCGVPEVSSYYLKSSGVLDALLESLTNSDKQHNQRLFLETCMTTSAFALLISKLQELLSRAENFEVTGTSSGDEKRSANILTKQLRLKLTADDASDIPKPYRNLMVSIHAIATMKALDDYLRPRLLATSSATHQSQRSEPTTSTASSMATLLNKAPDGLHGALAQLAAAGTALPESIRDRLASLGVDPVSSKNSRNEPHDRAIDRSAMKSDTENEENLFSTRTTSVELFEGNSDASEKPDFSSATPTKTSKGGLSVTDERSNDRKSSASKGPMSYAAALSATPQDWHIEFEVNGSVVPYETTIYGAVNGSTAIGDASVHGRPNAPIYQIKFRKALGPAPINNPSSSEMTDIVGTPQSINKEDEAASVLQLLDVLSNVNSNWGDLLSDRSDIVLHTISISSFVNTKLTAKLNRQLEEPLIVASQCLPAWSQELPRHYPFLFPFETRYLFLQSTSFGYSRSMTRWQAVANRDRPESRSFLGRLQRQKVRISRPRMLESAMKVMELYGPSPSILEVEYFDEVGTGLGPTLEFYSTVSKEVSRTKLGLWRDSASRDSNEFTFDSNGLFPRPLSTYPGDHNIEAAKKSLILFKTIGTFVARSMIDSRLIDIHFNPTFFRLLNNANTLPLSIGIIYAIDKDLARSLTLVNKFAIAFHELNDRIDLSSEEIQTHAQSIMVDGVRVEDLGLDFTYPGDPEIELIVDGAQTDVTIFNVALYVERVLDVTIGSGISEQLQAFKSGFSIVFPYMALRAFTPQELTMIFGHSNEDWSTQTLLESIKADHGYTMDSLTIRNLVVVLSELTEADRREFLQFITGSPRLPIGGFKSLTPQFTIVCKPHEAPLTANDYLPSVMTCVNYLKMPDYSSVEVLRAKLFTAMREGGGSFHLS